MIQAAPRWVRGLALAALLGAGNSVWALGLGDIELDSALNEKLRAEIELVDARGLQPTEIIVSLASPEDFQRVGVERFFFLTDLHFEVGYNDQGVESIQVTSSQPVTEPYLNFLVEVLWPNGRMLKEYTLLLDPPTFSPAPAPTVSAPSQETREDATAGRVERPTRSATATRGTQVQLAPSRRAQSSPLDEGVVGDEYRMTDRSDTLWSIATRTRASGSVSINQTMLAIQRLNPDAFLNGNINLLKAGYSLKLPSEQQARAMNEQQARAMVAQQNEDWRALRRGEAVPERGGQQQVAGRSQQQSGDQLQGRVDATGSATASSAGTTTIQDGELRIVAGAGDGSAASANGEQLNSALEEQDRLSREVESLTDELAREKEIASNQIAVKDRQLEVKDQQIAEMQAEMERLREQMQERQTAASDQSQNQNASGTEPWWQSTYVLGGAAGVVVLLLVYGLVAARRRRSEEDDFYPQVTADDALADRSEPAVEPMAELEDDEALDDLDVEAEPEPMVAAAAVGGETESAPEDTDSETGDVIGEADIYIAYGRYPQAIGLLLGVLEDDPDRNDVRLKLLELYAETRDREAFDTHMAELLRRCDDDEALLTARELGAQFGEEAGESGDGAAGEAADAGAELDLDELSPGDDAGAASPAGTGDDAGAAAAGASAAEAGEADAPLGAEDFELELDELAENETAAGAPTQGQPGDQLGGDLGIDFDPEREQNGTGAAREAAAPEPAAPEPAADAGDLDLDLDDSDVLGDDAFDFDEEGDTAGTKLDLARAYIDMGDQDGARDILNEVVAEGNDDQKQRANAMLEEL